MQHQPDFENLRRALLRQGPPGPVPFFELFADPGMVEAVLGEKFPVNLHEYIEQPLHQLPEDALPSLMKSMEMYVRFCHQVGYDYDCLGSGNTAANYIPKQNYLAMLDEGRRWNLEHFGKA